MGRRTTNSDILNGRVVTLDPDRGKTSLVPFTQTSVPVSLTATATLMGLTGPGVVSLAQIVDATGTAVRLRIHIDGYDHSLSTAAAVGVYPLVGMSYQTTGQMTYEDLPFRTQFKIVASKATGTATNMTFQTAYRLVEL